MSDETPFNPHNVGVQDSPPTLPTGEDATTTDETAKRNVFNLFSGEGRPKKVRIKKPPPPKPREGSLVEPLTELYATLGGLIVPFDNHCGTAIVLSAPKCAEAMEDLARQNPAVRRAIMSMVESSAWMKVALAHAPIVVAVMIHHVPSVQNAFQAVVAPAPEHTSNGYQR